MTSEDFAKIFYSNFTPVIDWANIDEIAWMYSEGLFTVSYKKVASSDKFIKRMDFVSNPKNGFMKNGESTTHLVLKSLAADYLVKNFGILEEDIRYEYPLIGFKADIIDKDLHFPVECGDTNALKLEKYLSLSTTDKMLILPYPHSADIQAFRFKANPRFFKYIKHKDNFLKQKRLKYR